MGNSSLVGARSAIGDIAGRFHEFLKLRVGDIRRIHPKTVDIDAVYRKGISHRGRRATRHSIGFSVATHREFSARNPNHALGRRAARQSSTLCVGCECRTLGLLSEDGRCRDQDQCDPTSRE